LIIFVKNVISLIDIETKRNKIKIGDNENKIIDDFFKQERDVKESE